MKKFEIASRNSGQVLGVYEGETAEAALLALVDDAGDFEVSVLDSTAPHPETRHFDSVHDALKVFQPEAIVHIKEVA